MVGRVRLGGFVGGLWSLAVVVAGFASREAAAWEPAKGPLMTRWAADVDPAAPLPEYPRPQLVRPDWQNLNGLWDYAIAAGEAAKPADWQGEILVPFPVESALSGVMKRVSPEERLWYRRSFTVPAGWKGRRVLLHFGAVDWHAQVFVNGQDVGEHKGGYDPFFFDITDALVEGEQELVVAVADPTDAGSQPRGKQVRRPKGIYYTPITGIWQTVWVEPAAATRIDRLSIRPDFDGSAVEVMASGPGQGGPARFEVEVLDGDTVVARGVNDQVISTRSLPPRLAPRVRVNIPAAKPWSPDSPHLYGLRITLFENGQVADRVESYFGMRKVEVATDAAGVRRLFLNGKPLFQYGPLDQGFWPDGLYTAPTDEALRFDIEFTKRVGFNMARKHVKVEPARWYHWCDKLGLLVWQDMPSGDRSIGPRDPDIERTPESARQFEEELREMIDDFGNHPSIVAWVPFNEGWGQYDTARIAEFVKERDPSRIVNSVSGWADRGVGDLHDIHHYPNPAVPPREEVRAVVLGEFGGLGLPVKGHTWQSEANWGYRQFASVEDLTDAYLTLLQSMRPMTGSQGLAAAVYTQTTDVEIEVNGLLTYDREVCKIDEAVLRKAHARLFTPPPPGRTSALVPAADRGPKAEWRYVTERPGDDWMKPGFDDAAWSRGPGGFGTEGTPAAVIGTEWNTPDIWLRREVDLPADLPAELMLRIHHDEDAEVWINGERLLRTVGYTTNYEVFGLTDAARAAIRPGKNIIAVHCRQTGGGQYIDMGIEGVGAAR
jgi:hypothetical protein